MKRLLVVDDSPTVRRQVREALRETGFEIVEAPDGVDGAAQIEEDRRIAMVICDVNMPRMNGLQMLEKVMLDPTNAALPVLMLTTEGQSEMMDRAKALGAKGWLIKPFKAALLVAADTKLAL